MPNTFLRHSVKSRSLQRAVVYTADDLKWQKNHGQKHTTAGIR
jgi:hypothetical protein